MSPRQLWLVELRVLAERHYSEPLDTTRAAVIRACLRSLEIDEARAAQRSERP
jgi:hypothetical protein